MSAGFRESGKDGGAGNADRLKQAWLGVRSNAGVAVMDLFWGRGAILNERALNDRFGGIFRRSRGVC